MRYRENFHNLILTDFFEFRLYHHGEFLKRVYLCKPPKEFNPNKLPNIRDEQEFLEFIAEFFSYKKDRTFTNPEDLAEELARHTRFLRDAIISQRALEEGEQKDQVIKNTYDVLEKVLIHKLKSKEFNDLLAQTFTYGLFMARIRSVEEVEEFKRHYLNYIPRTLGVLRELFGYIFFSIADLSEQIVLALDDIAAILDSNDLLAMFDKDTQDPILHFYETFLAKYDPQTRKSRGVYYTPKQVVSYIVRSLNHILKDQFEKDMGFGDNSVTVLDPAGGTLSFLGDVAELAIKEYGDRKGYGNLGTFIRSHLLKNLYAFEIMMPPYVVGHLYMDYIFKKHNFKATHLDRLQFYLTNTLDTSKIQVEFNFFNSVARESQEAFEVKHKKKLLVVLGNPPYSVSSANQYFFNKQMELYKKDVKSEKNIQPLSDDYIKFLRFAHWKIDQSGIGVIGMITNNSYLSGLIHRGMRKALMESFNEIYILNLHGNARIGEKAPDGGKDENVFDIMQGVSIAFFVKTEETKEPLANVFYKDLYGREKNKLDFLDKHDINSTDWTTLSPRAPYYFFVEKDFSAKEAYDKFIKVTEIFRQNSTGVTTHRDNFVVAFTKKELIERMKIFTDEKLLNREVIEKLKPVNNNWKLRNTHDFDISKARKEVREIDWEKKICDYTYRPFDIRYICYLSVLIDRDRYEIMQHFLQANLGLAVTRTDRQASLNYFFSTSNIVDRHLLDNARDSMGAFPLYLYHDTIIQFTNDEYTEFIKKYPAAHDIFSQIKETKEDVIIIDVDKITEAQQEKLSEDAIQELLTYLNGSNQTEMTNGEKLRLPRHRSPNINSNIFETLQETYQTELTPEELFYYIYAVLHSNIYRTTYAELLKIDFPRIPFTTDYEKFTQMAGKGKMLVDLHLLTPETLDTADIKFRGKGGTTRVEKVDYNLQCVSINDNKNFYPIPKDVWEYQVGGYQVCHKYLKDRKGRLLSEDEIEHYRKIVKAIERTIEIQSEIDEMYDAVEGAVVEV
jgi:predicted helicase